LTALFLIVGLWVSKESQRTDANPQAVRRGLKTAYLLCLMTAIGLTVVYSFQSFYPVFMHDFSDIFPPFVAGVAVLTSFFAMRRYWDYLGSRLSKIWLGFTLGMLLWFLGELGWAVYTMVLHVEIPYPSIADAFWLSGYVPLFIALLLYVENFQPKISVKMFLVAGVIVACMSAIVFSLLMIPVFADASQQDLVTLSISLAYPGLDIILFLEAVLGLLVFTVTRLKGRIGVAWLLINTAIFANVLGDMTFSYTTLNHTYYSGHPQELLFHWGYLLFALAFYVHSREL